MSNSNLRLHNFMTRTSKDKTFAYEEAVMMWGELGYFERAALSSKSSSDIELIYNIYKKYFNYNLKPNHFDNLVEVE